MTDVLVFASVFLCPLEYKQFCYIFVFCLILCSKLLFYLGWNSGSSVISSDTPFKGPYNKREVSHTLDLLRLHSSVVQGFPKSVGWLLGFCFARYYLCFASLYSATVINKVDWTKSYNIFVSRFLF